MNKRSLIQESIESILEWYDIAKYRIQHADEFQHPEIIKTYIGTFQCFLYSNNGDIHRGNCGIYAENLLPAKKDKQVIIYFPGFDYTNEELTAEIELKIKQLCNIIKEQKMQEDFE